MLDPRATPDPTQARDEPGESVHARNRPRAAEPIHAAARPGSGEPRLDWRRADLGRIRAVVDAVPEAVLVTEADGALRFTNRAADRLFADRPVVDRDDLLSRFEPVAVDRPEALPSADRTETREDAVIVRQRSRPTRWFALRTVPLDPDEPTAPTTAGADEPARPPRTPAEGSPSDLTVAFVLRDVTDSRDLRPVREAFVGLVSHELRTPITTIYAGSSVLARQPILSLPATRTLARDVSTEAARLYDLVEDLLVLARIERGVLDPLDEPVLIERVIESTIRVATERHAEARIQARPGAAGVAARGDATYIDQACRNVVLAMLRRPGQTTEPELEIEVRPDREAGSVDVAIRDRGHDVTDAELDHAFDLPDATGGPHQPIGGLGLFIARQVIEAMGGRAWAHKRQGGGLELGFTLRLDPAG